MARGRGGGRGSSRGQTHVAAASYKSSRSSGASKSSSTWAARGSAAAYGKSGTKDAAAAGAYKASRAHGGSKSDAKAAARGAAAAYDQMHGRNSGGTTYGGFGGYYTNSPSSPYGYEPWHRQYDESAGVVTLPTHVDSKGRMYFGMETDEKYYIGTDWKEVYESKSAEKPVQETKPSEAAEKKKSGGCYVATCVYGSYDCPEVWVLRRFRDMYLMRSWPGRAFVKTYYVTSPKMVERLGNREGFRAACRSLLDKMVMILRDKGFSEAPYQDPVG